MASTASDGVSLCVIIPTAANVTAVIVRIDSDGAPLESGLQGQVLLIFDRFGLARSDNLVKQLVIKATMYRVLNSEEEVERLFPIVKAQREY